jgi:hypothetical protein
MGRVGKPIGPHVAMVDLLLMNLPETKHPPGPRELTPNNKRHCRHSPNPGLGWFSFGLYR